MGIADSCSFLPSNSIIAKAPAQLLSDATRLETFSGENTGLLWNSLVDYDFPSCGIQYMR